MEILLKNITLCAILFKNASLPFQEKVNLITQYIETSYKNKLEKGELSKIESFVKLFDVRWKSVRRSSNKFESKYSEWLNETINLVLCSSVFGAPLKQYGELCQKSKKQRLSTTLSTISTEEVSDTFKAMLKKENQPFEAIKIASILPTASPKRLKRIVKSIPTPTSSSVFTEEEAIALMLQLKLSHQNYKTLRRALLEKGVDVLPSYGALYEKKKSIIPSPKEISDRKARIGVHELLENTASRIVSDFSDDLLKKVNGSNLQLICKWGCDGLSLLSEYKQTRQGSEDYKSVFMASLVPLRIRKYADSDFPSTSSNDVWINSTPGSKYFCRPISIEFTKESAAATQELVKSIETEIESLEPIIIHIAGYAFNISFDMKLTMIDGKVSNAITGTPSNWNCSLCGEKRAEFSNISKPRSINEDVLKYGISPLHARIRFLEFFLHMAYDLKYRSIPGNENKSGNMNEELKNMRKSEKERIQLEFKQQTGLNIDKPLVGYGNTNDGNTARRFFKYYETTSEITGIDMELLRRVNIILMAINSKHKVNSKKFGEYSHEISKQLITLYPWKLLSPTVHKILCHGEMIIQHNILPLGELTEESQESRNRDFKYIQQFSSRKCSRQSQNEDIFNNLLISSDPVLSSMRKRWICYRDLSHENINEYKDLLYLLDMDYCESAYFTELKYYNDLP